MAKLRPERIVESDLLEYLNSCSDFSFELAVLKLLRQFGINCEHGGHYEDPVTKKSREFDIRASRSLETFKVRMPIECKNIKENFPLLVTCVPRHVDESYHQVAMLSEPKGEMRHKAFKSRAFALSISGPESIYQVNEPVGKSTVQVGRTIDGSILANDSDLYEKWGQCLSSAHDMVQHMYWDKGDENSVCFSTVIPFVVVPNSRLWSVVYNNEGICVDPPMSVNRVSCLVNKEYRMGTNMASETICLSHIEIVTLDGLKSFIEEYLNNTSGFEKLFPQIGIGRAYRLTK